jgi:hypothetical protein
MDEYLLDERMDMFWTKGWISFGRKDGYFLDERMDIFWTKGWIFLDER